MREGCSARGDPQACASPPPPARNRCSCPGPLGTNGVGQDDRSVAAHTARQRIRPEVTPGEPPDQTGRRHSRCSPDNECITVHLRHLNCARNRERDLVGPPRRAPAGRSSTRPRSRTSDQLASSRVPPNAGRGRGESPSPNIHRGSQPRQPVPARIRPIADKPLWTPARGEGDDRPAISAERLRCRPSRVELPAPPGKIHATGRTPGADGQAPDRRAAAHWRKSARCTFDDLAHSVEIDQFAVHALHENGTSPRWPRKRFARGRTRTCAKPSEHQPRQAPALENPAKVVFGKRDRERPIGSADGGIRR